MLPELDDRPPDKKTTEVIRDIANSVTPMLSWTADYPSAHPSQKLPVLDIQTTTFEVSFLLYFSSPSIHHLGFILTIFLGL